jgi:CubicO group peptidase (beta-lactamase class C family)
MTRFRLLSLLLLCAFTAFAQKAQKQASAIYYPGKTWEKRTPASQGLNDQKLAEAIRFSIENESKSPRDLEMAHYQSFGREPFGEPVGPFRERGPVTGLVIRHGYLVAAWGEPNRVDMTFSVTKSFLSTVIGLAFDRGLIRSVDDTVANYVGPVLPYQAHTGDAAQLKKDEIIHPFESAHNRSITWDHLLRQTSDWEGTLWGKPEWADRPSQNPPEWNTRPRHKPGTVYEYNDVRVNALALAGLSVWRRPLPDVLREYVMDPIGASATWRWYGYENSYVVLDGGIIQSVSGGGHWGGGMFINAWDMARFGYLTLRNGKWANEQLLSETWLKWARTPTGAEPGYGFMNYFLNTGRKNLPGCPESSFYHLGNGTNFVYVDAENDLIVVTRWISRDAMAEFLSKVVSAVDK